RVRLLQPCVPVSAALDRDRVESVTVGRRDGAVFTLTALFFVDATELGDLLPITETEYVTGAEAQRDHGEPHAQTIAAPDNHQAFPSGSGGAQGEGEDHRTAEPAG